MDLIAIEDLEYPQPKLKTDVESLSVKTNNVYTGYINISNEGGGMLSGNIFANKQFLQITPSQFNSNTVKASYTINPSNISRLTNTEIIISSNGGEKIIPVTIRKISPSLETPHGNFLWSFADFARYAQGNSQSAGDLFCRENFRMWLQNLNFRYTEIYDDLIKDKNKERALENFLLLNLQKKPVKLSTEKKEIIHDLNCWENKVISGEAEISVNQPGYIDEPIITHAPWLSTPISSLTSQKFDAYNKAKIKYFIETDQIKRFAAGNLQIGKDVSVRIIAIRKPALEVKVSKEVFTYDDEGYLTVSNKNRSGVVIEVIAKDGFVKFEQRKYLTDIYAEIPFRIKYFNLGQFMLVKRPVLMTDITVRAGNFEKKITLTVRE